MSTPVTADDVLHHLGNVDFPATKGTLVEAAERSGAGEEVLRAIRAIPPVDYGNRDEVVRSLRLDPAPGRSAAQAAEQARADVPSGIAQPMRDPQQDRVTGEQRRAE